MLGAWRLPFQRALASNLPRHAIDRAARIKHDGPWPGHCVDWQQHGCHWRHRLRRAEYCRGVGISPFDREVAAPRRPAGLGPTAQSIPLCSMDGKRGACVWWLVRSQVHPSPSPLPAHHGSPSAPPVYPPVYPPTRPANRPPTNPPPPC